LRREYLFGIASIDSIDARLAMFRAVSLVILAALMAEWWLRCINGRGN